MISEKLCTNRIDFKKLTLTAWAKILLEDRKIDIKKYNRMIEKINKLST